MRPMTKLLKEALDRLSRLSPERQDEIASFLLAEMESDARWSESFAKSQTALEGLADEALEEHRCGQTRPVSESALDEGP